MKQKPYIERIVGEERLSRLKESPVYRYCVDTGAMIAFSIPVGMINEMMIAGMTLDQSLKSRAMGTIGNIITARPYGKFRDYVFDKFDVREDSGIIKRTLVDAGTFTAFQVPLYATILSLAGAEPDQVAKGCVGVVALSSLIGRPYGWFLDRFRTFFGLETSYKSHEKEKSLYQDDL